MRINRILLALNAALLAALVWQSQGTTARASAGAEYRVFVSTNLRAPELQAQLNSLAREGWSVVTVASHEHTDDHYILRRDR